MHNWPALSKGTRVFFGVRMKREPLIDVDLGANGGRVRLYSQEEIDAFVAAEESFWTEVTGGEFPRPFSQVERAMSRLNSATPSNGTTDDPHATFREMLATVFVEDGVPYSASPQAKVVAEVASEWGLEAARGALAAISGFAVDNFAPVISENPATFAGAVLAVTGEAGISRKSSAAAGRSLAGYAERRERQLTEDRDAIDAFLSLRTQELAEQENENRDAIYALRADYEVRFMKLGQAAQDSMNQILQTDAQFREQMHLQAPSEYWEKKARDHKGVATKLRGWIIGSVAVGAVVYLGALVLWFGQIKTFLLEFQGSAPALFIITGAAAFLLAIPLWFLRILVRFYLSEQHLASDAKERHIMALTYLALTTDAAMAEKDRAIVLSALFRSGHDGLVKESSGPDTGLSGILAKLLER